MAPTRARYDVCIVGGGPVGSAAAIAFARRGARVLVLEKDPRASRRFAGEWIHPVGVGVLDALRAGRLEGASPRLGYGFVIFPGDGSPPIELAYPAGVALSAPHESIVSALRDAALSVDGVEVVPYARVTSVDGQRVVAAERPEGGAIEIRAERIIGADGRSSLVRRELGFDDNSAPLSYMASVDLDDVELPREGFGHVMLGAPGPVLLYRVSEGLVRGCFDVPVAYGSASRSPAFLWEAFRPVLPEAMHASLKRGLERPNLRWAATRFRPRTHFGRGPVALVGDAVGHVHPMTAIGLSMGLLDAHSVASHDELDAYASERRGYVPELLSNALYHCFRRSDASARRMRDAMFDALRASPSRRRLTMQILSAQDQRTRSFGSVFLSVAAGAIGTAVAEARGEEGLRSVPGALASFREWIQWPAAALVPPLVRETYRARSTAIHPIPFLRALVPVANEATASLFTSGRNLPAEAPSPEGHAPVKAHAAPSLRVNEAVAKLTELLLRKLEVLGGELGSTPDEVLAAPGLRMMRAITGSQMRSGVAARMTIGQRWLARYSVPRLLEAAETRGAFATSDLAELLLFLLNDTRWGTVEVVGLKDGVDALLRLQTDDGGFGPRASGVAPGDDGDVRTTALACQALVLAQRVVVDGGDGSPDEPRLGAAIARALRWLLDHVAAEVSGGGPGVEAWSEGAEETKKLANTVWALEAFAAARNEASASWVRSASQSLASILAAGGLDRRGDIASTALALRGLLLAVTSGLDRHSESPSVAGAIVETTTRQLAERVLDRSPAPSDPAVADLAGWEVCSEVLETLALHQAVKKRGDRPRSLSIARAPDFSRGDAEAPAEKARTPMHAPVAAGRTQADWTFCRERLAEVSRSFSKPIALLPEHLEVAVTVAYLLCRVADSIEDHVAVPHSARAPLMARFLDVLYAREDPATFAAAFSREIGASAVANDPELVLTTNLAVVMRVLDGQSDATRTTLIRWVAEMARGMALYVFRPPAADGVIALETVSDLERYCYFVAGTVGHLLTDLFLDELGDDATPELALSLRVHAESFGMGLQLVNILKDLTDDQARRWSYIPRTVCAARGLRVSDLGKPGNIATTHDALAPLFDLARTKLDDGMRYTLAIPPRHAGIRRFCLLPLWMAARTLVLARGNDAMFSVGNPVKIPRDEVAALSLACIAHSGDDEALRAQYAALWADGASAEDRRSAG
jgi:phytoene/squalene synthetase/2-polyprenyl-6-methoxyphenol hydroxylase-like FAD-dependent oxidoreductase